MIKRYNQFVKGKINEDLDMERPPMSPESTERTMPSLGSIQRTPSEAPTNLPTEEEEVGTDKYTSALQQLADAAGAEFNSADKFVEIDGKRVTFPTETEKYHVEGVKKPFATLEEVLAYFEGGVNPSDRQEVRDEMSSIKDAEVLEEPSFEETEGDLARRDLEAQIGESKSYKSRKINRRK